MIKPRAWALVSGGKDSMTLAHVLASQDMLLGCVAFDTGIAAPDWRPFLESACADQGWPLTVLQTPHRYEDLVRKLGFPGSPKSHGMYMNYLKGRCVREFIKSQRGTLLASGVRSGESTRRFGSVREWSVIEGMPIWAPLHDWTTARTWEYMRAHKLARSPAYTTLGISGDCLCGAFASKGEREDFAYCYPKTFERIAALERETGQVWGTRKPGRGKLSKFDRAICVECAPDGSGGSGTR